MLCCPKCGADIDSEGYCSNSSCIYSRENTDIPPFKPGIKFIVLGITVNSSGN